MAFIGTLAYGAVIVPILPDFKSDNIQHLINHSEAKLAIIDENIWEDLNPESMPTLLGALSVKDYSLIVSNDEKLTYARGHLNELFGQRYPDRFTPNDVVYHIDSKDELCLISYTSGSTGFSKGVMLPTAAFGPTCSSASKISPQIPATELCACFRLPTCMA